MAGRGSQVLLDGAAQAAARGAAGASMRANFDAKRLLELAGLVSDGNTQDGSSSTGVEAQDYLLSGVSSDPVDVRDIGAALDGITDDTAALKNAILLVSSSPYGRTVYIPPGVSMISDTLEITACAVGILGAGGDRMTNVAPYKQQATSILRASPSFPAGKPMVRFISPPGSAHPIHANSILNIQLDCAGYADMGLEVVSALGFTVDMLSIYAPKLIGMHVRVAPLASWTGSNRAVKWMRCGRLLVRCDTASGSPVLARGLVLNGSLDDSGNPDDIINTNYCSFDQVYIQHRDGVGIDIYDADSCDFGEIVTFTASSGVGMVFNGGNTPRNSARDNIVRKFQGAGTLGGGGGGAAFRAGPTMNAVRNKILSYDNATNATPDPIFETQAINQVDYELNSQVTHSLTPTFVGFVTNPAANGTFAAIFQGDGYNDAGTRKTYGQIEKRITNVAAGAETAQWDFLTSQAGTLARRAYLTNGLAIGEPSVTPGVGDVVLSGNNQVVNAVLPSYYGYNSAAAAGGTFAVTLRGDGKNDAGARVDYAELRVRITGVTAGAHAGQLDFYTTQSGATARRGYMANGLVVGAPAGGDPGAGAINTETGARIGNGALIKGIFHGSGSLNFASISPASPGTPLTLSVTGARVNDAVILGLPDGLSSQLMWTAWVSASNVVSILPYNHDATNPVDPGAATFAVSVLNYT